MIAIADPSQAAPAANKSFTDEVPSQYIPLELIDPSPYQRRTNFHEGPLMELADSLRQHGQINDILVREKNGRFELLAGERRTRAGRLLEWQVIRAKVLVLDDAHAAELVLIEQLQTQQWDVLEEAQGYRMLLDLLDGDGRKMHTYESIGQRIGKSMHHVRELVSLLELSADVQQAVVDGIFAKRAAYYLTMVALPEDREKASRMALKPRDKTTPLSTVETVAMLNENFFRRLKKGSWDQDKADILSVEQRQELGFTVEGAPCDNDGSCTRCLSRSGKHPKLKHRLQSGSGVKGDSTEGISPDLCMMPKCHLMKSKAVEQAVLDKLIKRGSKAIIDDDAKNIFDRDGSVKSASDYVALDSKPDPTLCGHYNEEKLETWRALLKAHAKYQVQVYVARRPGTAEYVELVLWQDAVKSINEGMKEFGDKPIFTQEEKKVAEAAASDGPNIIVEKPKDTAFDSSADKENKAENRKLAAEKSKQAVATLQTLHANLLAGLKADPDDSRAHELFLYQMDQRLINPDALVMLRKVFGVGSDEEWIDGALPDGGEYGAADFFATTVTAFAAVCVVHWGLDGWKGLPDWQRLLGMNGDVESQPSEEIKHLEDLLTDVSVGTLTQCPDKDAELCKQLVEMGGEQKPEPAAEVIEETAAPEPAPAAKKTTAKKATKKRVLSPETKAAIQAAKEKRWGKKKESAKKAAAPPKAKIAKIKKDLKASYDGYKKRRGGAK